MSPTQNIVPNPSIVILVMCCIRLDIENSLENFPNTNTLLRSCLRNLRIRQFDEDFLLMQMLTTSKERFDAIQREAPAEFKNNLVQVTKYQAGKNCKVGWCKQFLTSFPWADNNMCSLLEKPYYLRSTKFSKK